MWKRNWTGKKRGGRKVWWGSLGGKERSLCWGIDGGDEQMMDEGLRIPLG